MTITLQDNDSYKLGSIILSKREPFTMEEIIQDLSREGIKKEPSELNLAIKRLKDNGIIIQWGSLYSVYR